MKKSILSAALAASLVSTSALADVKFYGSAEQAISITDGVAKIVGGSNDLGVMATEDLGNGLTAIANFELRNYTDEDYIWKNRKAYVGFTNGSSTLMLGKAENVEKVMLEGDMDIFQGSTSLTLEGADRPSNGVVFLTNLGAVELGASAVMDGADGEEVADSHELGAKINLGSVTLGGVYSKNTADGTDAISAVATLKLNDVNFSAAYQPDASAGKTYSALTQVKMDANKLRVGVESVTDGDVTYIAELEHNFSKKTRVYLQYAGTDADDAEPTTEIGMRVKF